MFSKIFKFGPFFAKVETKVAHDVDAIIADFTSAATELEAAATAHAKASVEFIMKADEYHALAENASAQSTKATKVAAQIKALVS